MLPKDAEITARQLDDHRWNWSCSGCHSGLYTISPQCSAQSGCSLDIGDRRIFHLLCRILWQTFGSLRLLSIRHGASFKIFSCNITPFSCNQIILRNYEYPDNNIIVQEMTDFFCFKIQARFTLRRFVAILDKSGTF